jgi:hypothetical protein
MCRLDILLLNTLHSNKAHVRSTHRFADRLGIIGVVLVALHVGLHELRRNQADGVASSLKFSRPMVRTGARFHTIACDPKQTLADW